MEKENEKTFNNEIKKTSEILMKNESSSELSAKVLICALGTWVGIEVIF